MTINQLLQQQQAHQVSELLLATVLALENKVQSTRLVAYQSTLANIPTDSLPLSASVLTSYIDDTNTNQTLLDTLITRVNSDTNIGTALDALGEQYSDASSYTELELSASFARLQQVRAERIYFQPAMSIPMGSSYN